MRILVISLLVSTVAFLVQWIVWRVRIPVRQTASILAIFVAVLVLGLVSSFWWPSDWRFRNAWEVLHVAIFHVAAMLAYVVAYSAIEEQSPSMTILLRVADSGCLGQTPADLQATLLEVSPVEIRLNAMIRDEMLREEGNDVVLTAKGWAWANIFSNWRRLLLFELGG